MTLDVLKAALPKGRKNVVNQELVDLINDAEDRGDFDGMLEDKFISLSGILSSGRYKIKDFIKATEFACYYIQTEDQADSYQKTFPEKMKRRIMAGKSAYANGAPSMYFSNQLVQDILAQIQLSDSLIHGQKRTEAYAKLYQLMSDPKSSPRIQMESANSLITHLKVPDTQKVELEIDVKKDESAIALESKLLELATLQEEAFRNGASISDLQKITYKEGVDDENITDAEIE